MKREVKFRGYCQLLKKWIYGCLTQRQSERCYIHYVNERGVYDYEIVVAESVGQEAINGIYEGDIFKLNVINSDTFIVEFHLVGFIGKRIKRASNYSISSEIISLSDNIQLISVIGNAFENPELLNQ